MPLLERPRDGATVNETPLGLPCPSGAAFGIALRRLGSSADRFRAERRAAESATLIQVSHPRRLLSESIRKRIDYLVLGHPDWTACCEDRRVRWASCKREVRDRGASPPSRALRGLEPTRILSAADGGTPLTRYVQARVPAAPTVACAICSPRTTSMSRLADASQRRTG